MLSCFSLFLPGQVLIALRNALFTHLSSQETVARVAQVPTLVLVYSIFLHPSKSVARTSHRPLTFPSPQCQ